MSFKNVLGALLPGLFTPGPTKYATPQFNDLKYEPQNLQEQQNEPEESIFEKGPRKYEESYSNAEYMCHGEPGGCGSAAASCLEDASSINLPFCFCISSIFFLPIIRRTISASPSE